MLVYINQGGQTFQFDMSHGLYMQGCQSTQYTLHFIGTPIFLENADFLRIINKHMRMIYHEIFIQPM